MIAPRPVPVVSEVVPRLASTASTARGRQTKDVDQDGVPDDADACPNAPETMNGYRDGTDSPIPATKTAMAATMNAMRAGSRRSGQRAYGRRRMSDILDKDLDGIADADDKCVDRPEVDGFEDEDGCPDTAPTAELAAEKAAAEKAAAMKPRRRPPPRRPPPRRPLLRRPLLRRPPPRRPLPRRPPPRRPLPRRPPPRRPLPRRPPPRRPLLRRGSRC